MAVHHDKKEASFCSNRKLNLVEFKDSMIYGQQGGRPVYGKEQEIYFYESGKLAAFRTLSWRVETSIDPETLIETVNATATVDSTASFYFDTHQNNSTAADFLNLISECDFK